MIALFRGLLPAGHPFAVLTCLGHRVRAVIAHNGHFYFCIVRDVVGNSKSIPAVFVGLDNTSTPLTGRSAIANGSACAIVTAVDVLLGTAGSLDLRFAANDHFAGAICAAADACAAAVFVIFCRYLSIVLNGDLGAALFAAAACAAADHRTGTLRAIYIFSNLGFRLHYCIAGDGDLGCVAKTAADHCNVSTAAPISRNTSGIHLIRSGHLSAAGDGNAGSPIFIVFTKTNASADAAIGVDHSITFDHDIFSRTATISAADPALGIHRTAIDLNMFGTTPVRSANGSAIQI